jgi:hypothetical protein
MVGGLGRSRRKGEDRGPVQSWRIPMGKNFRPSGKDFFYAGTLYEMPVPESHFLQELRSILDGSELTRPLLKV